MAGRGRVGLVCGLLAWVLWVDYRYVVGGTGKQEWWIVDAAESERACRSHASAKIAELGAPGGKGTVEKPSPNLVVRRDALSEGTVQVYRVLCLPDTIDPRGPKN